MTTSMGRLLAAAIPIALMAALVSPAQAQDRKPNIILILGDDHGYGDIGVYGGGEGRGMPSPNLDRLANEGMQFWSFYAQPSCTPGRAAVQTGRIPNRSGMTTVAFQGQGGGLPAAEWTLASVLKQGGYQTGAILSHEYFNDWGMTQGVDEYDNDIGKTHDPNRVSSDRVTDRALAWIARRPSSVPQNPPRVGCPLLGYGGARLT